MALFGRKKTTVGLDIGSGLIKVAVVDHSKAQPELVRVAITPLLADAIVEGEIMDPGIVADAITSCLAAAGVTSKSVVTAVGGRDVIIKKITIDRVKEQQARDYLEHGGYRVVTAGDGITALAVARQAIKEGVGRSVICLPHVAQ